MGVWFWEREHISLGAPSISHPKKLTASSLLLTLVQPTEGHVATGESQTWSLTKVQALALLLLNPDRGLKAHFLSITCRHEGLSCLGKSFLFRNWPASSLLLGLRKGQSWESRAPRLNPGSSKQEEDRTKCTVSGRLGVGEEAGCRWLGRERKEATSRDLDSTACYGHLLEQELKGATSWRTWSFVLQELRFTFSPGA